MDVSLSLHLPLVSFLLFSISVRQRPRRCDRTGCAGRTTSAGETRRRNNVAPGGSAGNTWRRKIVAPGQPSPGTPGTPAHCDHSAKPYREFSAIAPDRFGRSYDFPGTKSCEIRHVQVNVRFCGLSSTFLSAFSSRIVISRRYFSLRLRRASLFLGEISFSASSLRIVISQRYLHFSLSVRIVLDFRLAMVTAVAIIQGFSRQSRYYKTLVLSTQE